MAQGKYYVNMMNASLRSSVFSENENEINTRLENVQIIVRTPFQSLDGGWEV